MPSSPSSVLPGHRPAVGTLSTISGGRARYLAISLTCVLYRSPIGRKSEAPSPNLVMYPQRSSLLFPVPMTMRPSVFAMKYRTIIRARARRFPRATWSAWNPSSRFSRDVTIGATPMIRRSIPSALANFLASLRSFPPLPSGIATPSTCCGPSASAHNFATRAESTPPLSPRTTPFRPLSRNEWTRNASMMKTCSSLNRGTSSATESATFGAVIKPCGAKPLSREVSSRRVRERERGDPRVGRRVQPHGGGVRQERHTTVRTDRAGGRPPRGPETERIVPGRRHGDRAPRVPPRTPCPASGRRRDRPGGRRDLRRVVPGGERGHPEHPVRDARLAQHRVPRETVRRRGQQPRDPGPRLRPRVPGGPSRPEAVRAVRLQRMADRAEPVVRRVAGPAREARDARSVEGSLTGTRGGAARPNGSGGDRPGRSAGGPQGPRGRRLRATGCDDEDVPGPVRRRDRAPRLCRILWMV